MSASSMRSPRPASVASHQTSSPRLSSPLNPSASSFSTPHIIGHTPRNSPIDEMSDTLSPLRERLDSAFNASPRPSPTTARPRASSFSRSPERSPVTGTIPLQPHRPYARHPSASDSPFAQGTTFSGPSPFAGSSQSSISQNARTLSPSNSTRPGSPSSIRSTPSQFQPLCSPPHPTQSHFYVPQNSPVQTTLTPPGRYTHTQSFVIGNPRGAQVSPPLQDYQRNRRVSLDAGSGSQPSPWSGSMYVGHSFARGMPTRVKGDSTPLNEAPVRWWGGQRGWVDDWDHVAQESHGIFDPYATHLYGPGDCDGTMNLGYIRPGSGSPAGFPRGQCGSRAFLDDEIRASFEGEAGFAEPMMPGVVHPSKAPDVGYRMDGIPVPCAVPMSVVHGDAKGPDSGEAEAGGPLDGVSCTLKTPENLAQCYSYPVHSHGNTHSLSPKGIPTIQDREPGHGGRSRRFSDASAHSSMSYASCLSGPSQSQSQSLLVSPSHSHTSTCPSLSSLGIGIEEAEREAMRSKSIWRRRNSGSTMKRHSRGLSNGTHGEQADGAEGERRDGIKGELVLAPSRHPIMREKDSAKHGSMFFHGGSKHLDAADEQMQREGYNSAEKYVSMAVTSILPVATITMLSPVGEALVKARNSAKYIGRELAPVLKDTLSASADLLALAPLPGLEEAAKGLLCIWDACQKVDTNRLSCLRLAERCATLLYSVRCEISEAGLDTALGLAEPVERLCDVLIQIRTFLETQLHRPFLKRYVRREEIARELVACNEAITDAGSRFGISVQIRTYHEVCLAMNESKRYAKEAQALLSLDVHMMQRHCAMMYEQQMQTWRGVSGLPSGNALGLATDGAPVPAYGPLPSAMNQQMVGWEQNVPTSSTLSTTCTSGGTDFTLSAAPTPTRASFLAEERRTSAAITTTEQAPSLPTSPMHALVQVHRAQDTVDAAADEAALRGTLEGALNAKNDVEMVRCLQVARGEISEAAETLRRMLDVVAERGVDGNKCPPSEGDRHVINTGNTDLDRKFMQSGIEAMTRLTRETQAEAEEDAGVASVPELPSWTITRYEVIRTRKIGMGFFSDVYLGHWRKLQVVIKVLAHSVPREAFIRHVEQWNNLDHPNVLPLHGASSAVGDKPWFFVSKFCGGGSLAASLRRAKGEGMTMGAVTSATLLRYMADTAKGMAYLHGRGVVHGDLRAANVLVDEGGQCVVSDFGQCEIKSEAHRSAGKPESRPIRWRAPEMLMGNDQPTYTADVYAFAMCCIEILGVGGLPWETLEDEAIRELVLDKDERPGIPVPPGHEQVTEAVKDLVQYCWVRDPERRPSFTTIASALDELCAQGGPRVSRTSTPMIDNGLTLVASTESSPADEFYETASESMMTEIEEDRVDCMVNVSLTSPVPVLRNRAVIHIDTSDDKIEIAKISAHVSLIALRQDDIDTPTLSPTSTLCGDPRQEENYRLLVASNHSFHPSCKLTLPLWFPTRVDVGAVGYLFKPKGEFITLFDAIDPLQSDDERLRRLPSMYGYGKFEVHRREEGKRSVAQRGLDAISGFLTFKARGDRSHPERITRQYTFPLVQGKPTAHLYVEKTVHRFMDQLEVPKMWFKQHANIILEVLGPRYGIQKENLMLVVGTLEAPDWALFVSDDPCDGRAQFNVFSGRDKGEPWGMYTVERAIKSSSAGQVRWADVGKGTFASKVSSLSSGGHDTVGDTVMLSGLRFEQGMEVPTVV